MTLIRFLKKYSSNILLLALAAGLLGGAASVGLLFVISAGLSARGVNTTRLIYGFLGLALLAMITRASSALLLAHVGQGALFRLRMDISRKILGVPLRRLEEVGAPRLLGILTDDIPNIINAVANIPLICVNIAGLLACLTYLAWLAWPLFLAIMVLIVLGVVTYQLPFLAATKHFAVARAEHNNILSHIRSLIAGVKELKLNRRRRRAFMEEMLQRSSDRFQASSMSAMRIYILGATWGEMLSFVTIGLLVFAIPHILSVSGSTLTTFVLILLYMMEPIEYILNQAPQISKASVALKNIEQTGLSLAKDGSEESPIFESNESPSFDALTLDGVVFSYALEQQDERFVLGPVDLSFSPGEVVFLTGGNGSGKTTLAKLLVGLYKPERGKIALNGHPITEHDLDNYRQQFAAVFSDFYLFESLLGMEKTNLDTRAETYLMELQLSHKVKVRDGILSTTDLSQGQRKRLALLTAYLDDRPIFVFDEWAADQDAAFKDVFYYQILRELKARGKSVFVVTHDVRYFDAADRVIRLENGQVIADESRVPLAAEAFAAVTSGARQAYPAV